MMKKCFLCGKRIEEETGICEECCRTVLEKAPAPVEEEFGPVFGVTEYEKKYREILKEFKYYGRQDLGIPLGYLMYRRLKKEIFEEKERILVPVPMHRVKFQERKYNQSLLLANEIGRETGIKTLELLVRRQIGETQAKLGEKDRIRQTKGIYEGRAEVLVNTKKTLVLVDDVRTTGATLRECGKVLEDMGFHHIEALVFSISSKKLSL